MAVTAENKALAAYLRAITKSTPTVRKFWDEEKNRNVDILTVIDNPVKGVSTYATLGLSDIGTGFTSDGISLGVELILALATQCVYAPNIIASCAFSAMNGDVKPIPGAIIRRIVELYGSHIDLPHALLTTPFLWDLETQRFSNKTVAWLQIVPISDTELDYAEKSGTDELETEFENQQIDVFNIQRNLVV